MIYILIAIIAAGVLVLVHEFGHFALAKLFGMPVEIFSIGYGRPIIKFKRGETVYGIGAFPLGGYVKIIGLDPRERELLPEDKKSSFKLQPYWKRALVVSGGPIANILLAAFLFAAIFMIGVPTPTTTIEKVLPNSPAKEAGFRAGDKIIAVEKKTVSNWKEVVTTIRRTEKKELEFQVLRKSQKMTLRAALAKREGVNFIGVVARTSREVSRLGLLKSLYQGLIWAGLMTAGVVQAFYLLIIGKLPFRPVSPIGIVQITSQAAAQGINTFLEFLAFITIVLGITNFLPIFPLDGGRVVMWTVEKIKGSPLKTQTVVIVQVIGIGLLVVLLTSAVYLDIFRPLPTPFK
ncbi:MAG: site-2 protease family protein [Actinomycetota bacterium]